MIKFDLLRNAIIKNSATITGSQYLLNVSDINSLLDTSTLSNISIVNKSIGLDIDLGTQSSIYQIQYKNSPLTSSGVEIKYGRSLGSMTTGAVTSSGGQLVVAPTQSGYTQPRFIKITDSSFNTSSGVLQQFNILNTDSEIKYGEFGNLETLTLIGDIVTKTSDILEIPIIHSGNLLSDLYVSIDSNLSSEILENLEIGLTSTGTFYSVNANLSIPESIPWELGNVNNLKIKNNELWFNNPVDFSSLNIGSLKAYNSGAAADQGYRNMQMIELIDIDGKKKLAKADYLTHAIHIIDPLFNTRRISVTPPYSVLTGEQDNCSLTWDGNDSIYFLNGKNTQTVYKYSLINNTFSNFATTSGFFNYQNRQVAIINNDLYIYGGSAVYNSGNQDQLWKINLDTLIITQLATNPIMNFIGETRMVAQGGDLYFSTRAGGGQPYFLKYSPTFNNWTQLAAFSNSNGTTIRGLSSDIDNARIILHTVGTLNHYEGYQFNISTSNWSSYTTITDSQAIATVPSLGTYWRCQSAGLYNNGSILAVDFDENSSERTGILKIINTNFTINQLGITSGSWTSPPIRVSQSDLTLFSQPYLNYIKQSGVVLDAVGSIGVDNIQVRGFNELPTAQNTLQLYTSPLSSTEFLNLTTGGSSITVSGNSLILSHQYIGNTYNSVASTFQFPLYTLGKMQYSFLYNPTSNRTIGSTHYSRFYLVPYLDTLLTGDVPSRNSDSLVRTGSDSIYIEFGNASDSNGITSAIKFFNGSTLNSASINLISGNYYSIILTIDWENATYKLYVDNIITLTGIIPSIQIQKLFPNHTYEVFSASQNVGTNEKYKVLSITRLGNIPSNFVNYTPFVLDDSFYGKPGSTWNNYSLLNLILPKTEFIQFNLVLKSDGTGVDQKIIKDIKFPYTLVLKDMSPGEKRNVYLKYKFPNTNQTGTSTIYLNTWTRDDK